MKLAKGWNPTTTMEAVVSIKNWTPEQLKNAQLYGVCRGCKEPFEGKIEMRDGTPVGEIVCSNGHPLTLNH